jgi:hypothetical protein
VGSLKEVHAGLGKEQDIYLSNNQSKWAGGIAQAVKHLSCKYKALGSNSSTVKIKKKEY